MDIRPLPVKEELEGPVDSFFAPPRNEKATHDGDVKESGGRDVVQDGRPPVRILRIDGVVLEPGLLGDIQQPVSVKNIFRLGYAILCCYYGRVIEPFAGCIGTGGHPGSAVAIIISG